MTKIQIETIRAPPPKKKKKCFGVNYNITITHSTTKSYFLFVFGSICVEILFSQLLCVATVWKIYFKKYYRSWEEKTHPLEWHVKTPQRLDFYISRFLEAEASSCINMYFFISILYSDFKCMIKSSNQEETQVFFSVMTWDSKWALYSYVLQKKKSQFKAFMRKIIVCQPEKRYI